MWSEDDTSDVETSLNLTKICSLNFSIDEPDDFQLPVLLPSNNVTVRRKTKKKRGVSNDKRNEKYSSQSENTFQDLSSPFLDDPNYRLQISSQENAMLYSTPVSDEEGPDVCRELKNDFEKTENCVVDCQLSNSFLENSSLKVRLEQKVENTKLGNTGEGMKWLNGECKARNSFKQVAVDTTPSFNNFVSSKNSEKHLTSEDIASNSKGKSVIFTNSFRSLENDQLQKIPDSVCGQIENCNNHNTVYGEGRNSYNEPAESNTRSSILLVPAETKTVIDQNVFQSTSKFDIPPTNGKQTRSDTGRNAFLTCLNKFTDDNVYNVESSEDENVVSSKCSSRQNESNTCNENVADLVSSSSIRQLLKEETAPTKKSPLVCQLNRDSNDGNDEQSSNKENVCTLGKKKKVVILSSDSDSDSVWEDALDSDDSDCRKYNIPLSCRLEKYLSLGETKDRDTKTDDTINKPKYVLDRLN